MKPSIFSGNTETLNIVDHDCIRLTYFNFHPLSVAVDKLLNMRGIAAT